METYPTCPFAWDAVPTAEVGPRILAVTQQLSQLLRDHAEAATQRPEALADEIATAAALFTRTFNAPPDAPAHPPP